MNRLFLRGIVVSFFLCLTGSLAFGASNRTFVASNGTNNATCGRTTPCDTFAHALAATSNGGEIDVLDSADYGPVTIAQSVSIVAQGVVAGIQVTSGDAIDVNGANVVVLRGLTLDGLGSDSGASGIVVSGSSGGELHIESCTINNFGFDGIFIEPLSGFPKVYIKDTIVRNNANHGILFISSSGTVTASLDNVRTENNGHVGILAADRADVSVRNNVSAGNGDDGFKADSSSGGRVVMSLESSMASGSAAGVHANGANSTINMSNVTVVDNTTGLSATSGGHIVSFGNNKVTDNTTNGSPTKTIAQK
jgi:hypothetical protein